MRRRSLTMFQPISNRFQESGKTKRNIYIVGYVILKECMGWSGGAMVLGKLSMPGRPTNLGNSTQRPTALAVGAGGGCLGTFSLVYHFSCLSPSLWETARYRLKYCLKGPLSPKQPTNQPKESKGLPSRTCCKHSRPLPYYYEN